MGHGHTVSILPRLTLTWVRCNRNHTIRALGALRTTGEDGIGEWELKVLGVGLACLAAWNGVENVPHRSIRRNSFVVAILLRVGPSARLG